MQWENLTSGDFAEAARQTGVCVIAMGVVERHADHLPLGTDFLIGHKIACLAAEKEPAVVFPPFYFGQIYEARCFPGTLTLKPTLLIDTIQGVFDEIGRNGFKKIIVYNWHGGNTHLLCFMTQCSLWEEKPYQLYMPLEDELRERIMSVVEGPPHHACEYETSLSMAIHGSLVKADRIWDRPSERLNRLNHMPKMQTGIGWYSNYPEHYAGDARKATQEKGKALLEIHSDALAEFISAVKSDNAVPALNREFFERVGKVGK